MSSRLSILRSRLARLRRARALLRYASAVFAFLASLGLALSVVFFLDWLFRLPVLERSVVLALAAAGVGWAYWRLVRPLLGHRESEVETALFVERQHDIDSDLVAALEFTGPRRHPTGSAQLADAVVDYVGDASAQIDVFHGLSAAQFLRRFAVMVAVVASIAVFAGAAPRHAAVFVDRLLLGSQAYPTRTRIEQVLIGEASVFSARAKDALLADVKAPEGQPVKFTVVCAGAVPSSSYIEVSPVSRTSAGMRIELKAQHTSAGGERTFIGQLPRLVEDATFRAIAGDAVLPPAKIRMIPLPIVELQLAVKPPAYAEHSQQVPDPASRTTSILEGSSVQFLVHGANGKPLKSVQIALQGPAQHESVNLVPLDEKRLQWASANSDAALANLRSEVRYEVQAIDDDSLMSQTPLRGVIRVRPDLAPTASVELVHRVVLPAARPVVTWRASDDFGIAAAELVVDVERASRTTLEEMVADIPTEIDQPQDQTPAILETYRYSLPLASSPLRADQLPLGSAYPLALEPLKLLPGDRLKLTIEVTDYRGQAASDPGGTKAMSEARVLEIADESAVLAAIREADQRSEAQLNDLIRRQLGIGEPP